MAGETQLLYLEPDDEITSVVRRLRESDAGRVVLVASGRSKATTSAVALRLLAGVAADEGREVALVADAAGRALASEAGIPAFASVADASANGAVVPQEPPSRRAPIHVVREGQVLASPRGGDETQAVPVAAPAGPVRGHPPTPRAARAGMSAATGGLAAPLATGVRRVPRAALGALVGLVLLGAALMAAVAPAASIVIEPRSVEVGPVAYTITLAPGGVDEGQVEARVEGTATGVFRDPSPASGSVVFSNWNTVVVEVPAGTVVAAGETLFVTAETIQVPNGLFGLPILAGEASVGVVADEPGPAGNVEAGAIDTIVTDSVRNFLRGFPNNPERLVVNPDPTAGGAENRQAEITQEDVDAAAAALGEALTEELERRLVEEGGRVYAPLVAGEPAVRIPEDLVGTRGDETFELDGTLAYRRAYVERQAVEEAARQRLLADATARPPDTRLQAESIELELGEVRSEEDRIQVEVTASARAEHVLDVDALREQLSGLTAAQAIERLRPLGDVSVELWPGWVERVPELPWRIEVRVEEPT